MGKAELCPPGTEITTEKECKAALRYASSIGIFPPSYGERKSLATGSWDQVPYQCSYQALGDHAVHFNQKKTSNVEQFLSGFYKMICKQGS